MSAYHKDPEFALDLRLWPDFASWPKGPGWGWALLVIVVLYLLFFIHTLVAS